MFFKALRDIARPQWFEIIRLLKRSTGMSVNEMSKELKMSYMGVKQHCIELEKKGYVDTWRRPKAVGRPEKVYRLTVKTKPLFPQFDNELAIDVLETTDHLHGPNAAEKLLFSYFQKKGERYAKQVRGVSAAEKAASLAKIREKEGFLSECEFDNEEGLRIVEYHSPFVVLADKYPTVYRMEQQMMERLIGAKIERGEERASGLVRYTFSIRTL